jgi:hypothetical protein
MSKKNIKNTPERPMAKVSQYHEPAPLSSFATVSPVRKAKNANGPILEL